MFREFSEVSQAAATNPKILGNSDAKSVAGRCLVACGTGRNTAKGAGVEGFLGKLRKGRSRSEVSHF